MSDSKPTLDQRRAAHAWKAIATIKSDQAIKKSYGTEAKKLQTRILTAGLAASLAFLRAKGHDQKTKGHDRLFADLSDWTVKERNLDGGGRQDLLERIIKGNSLFLRRATEETLAYLQWLVRFAEAEGLTDENAE